MERIYSVLEPDGFEGSDGMPTYEERFSSSVTLLIWRVVFGAAKSKKKKIRIIERETLRSTSSPTRGNIRLNERDALPRHTLGLKLQSKD